LVLPLLQRSSFRGSKAKKEGGDETHGGKTKGRKNVLKVSSKGKFTFAGQDPVEGSEWGEGGPGTKEETGKPKYKAR